jgi:hypothetical protein
MIEDEIAGIVAAEIARDRAQADGWGRYNKRPFVPTLRSLIIGAIGMLLTSCLLVLMGWQVGTVAFIVTLCMALMFQ